MDIHYQSIQSKHRTVVTFDQSQVGVIQDELAVRMYDADTTLGDINLTIDGPHEFINGESSTDKSRDMMYYYTFSVLLGQFFLKEEGAYDD